MSHTYDYAAASGAFTVVAVSGLLLLLLLLAPLPAACSRSRCSACSCVLVTPVVATHTLVCVVAIVFPPTRPMLLLMLTLLAPPVALMLGMLLAGGASKIAPVRTVPRLLLPAAAVLVPVPLLAAVCCVVLGPRPSFPAKLPLAAVLG
jgi:hypothetical protein